MKHTRALVAVGAALSLLPTAVVVADTQVAPEQPSSSLAASAVAGGRIKVVLKGDRQGRKAKVRVVGVKGKAKGWATSFTIKKKKIVKKVERPNGEKAKPLPSGKYRVSGALIDSADAVSRAKAVVVKVSSDAGGLAVLQYKKTTQSGSDEPTDPAPPTPTPTPSPTGPTPRVDAPPGPVTGLKTGKITGTTIKLEWQLPGDADLDQILVRRAQGATAPVSASDGTEVDLPFKAADFTTDVGLTPDRTYSYAVFSRDDAGNTTGPVNLSTVTEDRGILSEAVSGSGPSAVTTALVVDEDESGSITIDDVVVTGVVSTVFDASVTAPLQAKSLRVIQAVTNTDDECSLRHDGSAQNVMTFRKDAGEETWIDAGPSATTTLTDKLSGGGDDVISIKAASPTLPGVDVNLTQASTGNAAFLDVFPSCVTQ